MVGSSNVLGKSLRAPRTVTSRAATTTFAISVVIVNFCQWKNTARLVRQLRRSETMKTRIGRIVIVDNGSKHHSLEARLQKLRGVELISNGENLGFATAVNRGVAACVAEWTLLLNPDVTVPDEFLDEVLLAAERLVRNRPKTGVIGFKLQNRDGTTQPSCGPLPTLGNTIAAAPAIKSEVLGETLTSPAFTGSNAFPMALAGAALFGFGSVLVLSARRRTKTR